MTHAAVLDEIIALQADCAAALDDGRLEDWPGFFTPDCFYRITTRQNHDRGLPAGVVYADSRQMLVDRVLALRKANVYESQQYRHLLGLPRVSADRSAGERTAVETGFAVLRIMRTGETAIFASGRYLDEVVPTPQGLRLARRDVVCDSQRIDTLLAIPL